MFSEKIDCATVSCVYYSRRFCIHDEKFLRLLSRLGVPTHAVFVDRSDYPIGDLTLLSYNVLADMAEGASSIDGVRVDAFQSFLRCVNPSWIIAGPLWPCTSDAVHAKQPLLAISWAFDLVIDAFKSQEVYGYVSSALRRADAILFDNPAISNIAKKMVASNAPKYVFPWGVDTKLFLPNRNKSANEKKSFSRVIHNRGLTDVYRPDFILNGFLESKKENMSLRLVYQSSIKSFESFIRERHGNRTMDGISQVDLQENRLLPDTLNLFDVYVTASASDGTSISLLEAMACGLLVLVPNSEANLHVIGKKNASLQSFQSGNLDDFSRKLTCLSKLPSPRSELLRYENRARCVSGFSRTVFEAGFSGMISEFRSRYGV